MRSYLLEIIISIISWVHSGMDTKKIRTDAPQISELTYLFLS